MAIWLIYGYSVLYWNNRGLSHGFFYILQSKSRVIGFNSQFLVYLIVYNEKSMFIW